MTAYYNEIDPFAAAWLRELIKAGHIADGVVDERSIEDVTPDDLRDFTQCHFFAGIGVWSYALRQAGWPDDRPVWTGSCPCQPFSAAGKGGGFADERHLWPSWDWLIEQRRPAIIIGEQVASKDAEPWLDLVQSDLEGMDYAFGAVAFPSAGIGAPHIRDRTYWVADTADAGRQRGRAGETGDGQDTARSEPERLRDAERLANTDGVRQPGLGWRGQARAAEHGEAVLVAYPDSEGLAQRQVHPDERGAIREEGAAIGADSAVRGFWSGAQWLWCSDQRWRPVEPGTFPLAHGAPARVGRLRGYGNAINAQAAQVFIEAYLNTGHSL